MSLAGALTFTSNLDTSDPRDFIYGSLGTVRPVDARLIIPTYSKSVAEVFKEAFRIVWLFDPHPLHAIGLFSFQRVIGSPGGLPSWAPDLANHHLPEFCIDGLGLFLRGTSKTGRASWQSTTWPTFNGDIMLLEAIEFDEIEKTERIDLHYGSSPNFEDDDTHQEIFPILEMAEDMLEQGLQRHVPDNDRLAYFRKTKLLDPIWKTLAHWPEEGVERSETHLNDRKTDEGGQHNSSWKFLSRSYARTEGELLPELEQSNSMSMVDGQRMLLWEIMMRRQDIPKAWKEAISDEAQNDERKLKTTVLNRLLQAIKRRCHKHRIFLTKSGF